MTAYEEYKNNVMANVAAYLKALPTTTVESVTGTYTVKMLAELIGVTLKVGDMIDSLNSTVLKLSNPKGLITGVKIVPIANIAVQLPVIDVPFGCDVIVMAASTNIGTIYVGHTPQEAQDTSIAFPLILNQGLEFRVRNLSAIWISASNANDKISWTVEKEEEL